MSLLVLTSFTQSHNNDISIEHPGSFPNLSTNKFIYLKMRNLVLSNLAFWQITNSEEQVWDLLNATIEKEMLGTSGALKRGWNEYSIMDLSLL